MECDSASDYITAFKGLRPIGALQAFNGRSELPLRILKRLLLCLVNLSGVLLDQVGKTLGPPSGIQFRLTAWLLLALRHRCALSPSNSTPIIAPGGRSPHEIPV